MTGLIVRVGMSVLTFLYALLAMVSCSVVELPAATPVGDVPQQEEQRTLRILNSRGDEAYALQLAADAYVELHPDVRIQIQTIEDENDYRAALRARLLGGEAVDLFHVFSYSELLELEPYLTPIGEVDQLAWVQEAVGDLLEPVTRDGVVWAAPYAVEGVGLLVNRGILDAAEVTLGADATPEELAEAFDALRERIVAGELEEDYPDLVAVSELPGRDRAYLGGQLLDVLLGAEFSGTTQALGAHSVLLAEAESLGAYVDLLCNYSSAGRGWAALAEVPEYEQVLALALGRVALAQQSTAVWRDVRRVSTETADELRLLPIPLREDEPGVVYIETPCYWAIGGESNEESAALAADFLTWLYTSEQGATRLAEEFALLSPYQGSAVDTDAALHEELLGYIAAGRSRLRYRREFPAGYSAAATQTLQEYLTDPAKTWAQVSDELRESWTTLR